MTDPRPFEEDNPELAEHIRMIANRTHPVVKSLNIGRDGITILLNTGQVKRSSRQSPNDLCRCGSGRKFKKCCGRR